MSRRKGPRAPQFDATDHEFGGRPVDELDLHGRERGEVEGLVRGFLESCARRSPGALVHIITGKGRGSAAGPVLLPAVRTLLKTTLAHLVLGWAADDADGGFVVKVR
jgi:DNA-nicking Smr family endonuclease